MSAIYVQVGWRVARGAIVGASGASGYGSDWYYGPHVHVTLLPSPWTSLSQSIDFQLYVGGAPPKPPDPPKPPEPDVKVTTFSKKLALGKDGTQTIKDGQSAFLALSLDSNGKPNSTKLVTGPNLNVTAVLNVTFKNLPLPYVGTDGKIVVPESVQVEPMISTRQSDGSITDSTLRRQEVIATPGLSRDKVPIDAPLTSDKQYLRVMVYAPAGLGDVIVAEAAIRGAEYLKT